LLTGEQRDKALALADELGIEANSVYYECPPEEKGNLVKKLQSEDQQVAFVGDGVNDAPALIYSARAQFALLSFRVPLI